MSQPRRHSNKKNESQNHRGKQSNRKQDDDFGTSMTWICKNAACKACLPKDDSYCKRCSCCICHSFDENKDPSLWLVCEPQHPGETDFCGLSCHLECAFRQNLVGVLDLDDVMSLDGNFCCFSCGKISGVLRCWKKQLMAAKDARRVDSLCYRIHLSYRLLDGTSRLHELHEIVKSAKSKLEDEFGPLDGAQAKMARGIVSRVPVGVEVQQLCTTAIDMVDDLLANASTSSLMAQDSRPAACKFNYEEITSRSITFQLVELPGATSSDIKGYKLWWFQTIGETPRKLPNCILREYKRLKVFDLMPCTEYTFRVISYTEAGDLGHTLIRCFTKSIEITIKEKSEDSLYAGALGGTIPRGQTGESSGFKISEYVRLMQMNATHEERLRRLFYREDTEKVSGMTEERPIRLRGFDLNEDLVPDLNEEFTPPVDLSGGEDNGVPLGLHGVAADDEDAASNGVQKNNGVVRSDGSGGVLSLGMENNGQEGVPEDDFIKRITRKRKGSPNDVAEPQECDSTLAVNGVESAEHAGDVGIIDKCVNKVRWLEINGYVNQDFRLKFITWFCLRSTVMERRVINAFVQTLEGEPGRLAVQLRDSYSQMVSDKSPSS